MLRYCRAVRVAFISSYACECGIATYTDDLGSALKTRGHDVSVLAMSLDARAGPVRGASSLPFQRCWSRNGDYRALAQALARLDADVVHIQHEYGLHRQPSELIKWLRGLGRPCVVTLHTVPIPGHEGSHLMEWLPRFLAQTPHLLIAHQRRGAEALGTFGCSSVTIIPHGTRSDRKAAERCDSRLRLDLPEHATVAATVGFWALNKRNSESVDVVINLVKARLLPRRFVFVVAGLPKGTASEKEMRRTVALVNRNGLDRIIRIRPGFVAEASLDLYFGAADFVIANSGPTHCSVSGRGHMAMAYGAAVLASDVPLFEEFRHCGRVFSTREQLENGICELAAHPELRAELSIKVREYAKKTAWERVAELHEQAYEEVTR